MQLTTPGEFSACQRATNLEPRSRRALKSKFCRALPTALAVLSVAALVQFASPPHVAAQNCSPYSNFQSMTDPQLATLQAKLVYVGVSNGLMSSLVFTAQGHTPDLTLFDLCNQEGFSDSAPTTFSAGVAELRAVLNNVGTLPAVTAGGVAADPFLAFSLANSQPAKAAFEVILDSSAAADLFIQLRKSLASNKVGTLALSKMGCSLGLNEPGQPTDVSAGFGITMSGVRLKRSTNTFVGTLTVTNNSGSTPSAPLSVVFDLPINVTIVNPDGITCTTALPGRGFINLSSIPAPGASVSLPLEFNNPDLETLTLQTTVFAGPGAR